jgi:nicotinamide phosphoribosyltransferase
MTGNTHIVHFGLQYVIKNFLIEQFNENFFNLPHDIIVKQYQRRMDYYLGAGLIKINHISALHKLGYLPIRIKALPEGSLVPLKVPMWTIVNTKPEFYWITNYLETALSNLTWEANTSATTAYDFKKTFDKYADETVGNRNFVPYQGHDFSFRGMSGIFSASLSGAAHLVSGFVGTDTIPAIDLIEQYYNSNVENELIGCSVAATEHATMSAGTKEEELNTYKRLLTEIYPNGILSIVSDTWSFWDVITKFTIQLKHDIMNRDGKCVFRPDTGDPVKIVCGDLEAQTEEEIKGAVECLWDIFGGTINEKGYKELDSHVGIIYGDSITLDRQKRILEGLKQKGFASNNIVLGIGSYTYRYTTRDSVGGFAVKATYCEVDGAGREIFKNPATDKDNMKKSAKGLLYVGRDSITNEYYLEDQVSWEKESQGELRTIFEDGKLLIDENFSTIRERLNSV